MEAPRARRASRLRYRAAVADPDPITLPGGTLTIAWGEDGEITMTGPAAESFRGSFDPAHFA